MIISGADELQDAEPVTERIAHFSDATPREGLNFIVNLSSGCQRALDRSVHIFHLEVQMHRRPVAAVISRPRNPSAGRASRWFCQKINNFTRPEPHKPPARHKDTA